VTSTAEPGLLAASADPDVARRAWPRWLVLGLGMLAVAAVGLFWPAQGARVLLGATGLFLLGRGVVVLRDRSVRGLGIVAVVAGLAAAVVAALSVTGSAAVLLVAVPVLLLGGAAALARRSRRGGLALLVWALLLTALLVGSGLARGWDSAAGVATVVAGLVMAGLAVPVLIGAVQLRAVANGPAPPIPAGCAGCACGAGGCGALG
jgi:hypothetical protein